MHAPINRVVPGSVVWRLFLHGIANQVAWLLLGLGLIAGWIVIFSVDLSFVYYLGAVEQTTGTITDSVETSVTLNDAVVMINMYRFVASNGRRFEDYSYATGRWYKEGESVTIEYPHGKPQLSRIQGMRRKLFGPYALWLLLGPIGGVGFLALRVRRAWRLKRLLQHGVLTGGTLVDKEATNTRINEALVYKLTFAYTAQDGRTYQVVHKTHITAPLEDDKNERLLYDAAHPQHAFLVDALPGRPTFDKRGGQIRPQPVSLLTCILPGVTLAGHGLYALAVVF